MLNLSESAEIIIKVFFIAAVGYMVGRIQIKEISLGTAAIFLSGLVFGHFGLSLPIILQNIGLVLFITAVGFSAGPGFIQRMKKDGLHYIVICLTTVGSGCVLCVAIIRILDIDAPLAVGLMTGAFTTSPGFAAAKEAVAGSAEAIEQVAAGYGMSYPFGVICKVILIQMIPKLLDADMVAERNLIKPVPTTMEEDAKKPLIQMDKMGLFSFCLAVIVGIFVGSIYIPLPGDATFSLGIIGGPLIAGLFFSCFGSGGKLDLRCSSAVIAPFKEIGLLLFLSGAGVEGGKGVANIFIKYGIMPIILILIIVTVTFILGFCVAYYILKMPLLNGLGAMTASMTCTPSLATLTQISGTDDVVAAYATAYPIALIILVLVVQFLVLL